MKAKELLLKEINDLQLEHQHVVSELESRVRALRRLDADIKADERGSASSKTLPYFGIRTWKAIQSYLEKRGQPVSVEELTEEMIRGGAFLGKARDRARKHVMVSARMSKHIEIKGDKVSLSHSKPERKSSKG